jgi:rRNA maturation endonuclease Nob1
LRLEAASQQFDFHFQEPCTATLAIVRSLANKYGVKRLSPADESVIGLALELVERGEKVNVFTDDYSIQNVLKWRKIPFSGILQTGIKKARSFAKKRTST